MPDVAGQDPATAKKEAAQRSAEQRQRELAQTAVGGAAGNRTSSDSGGTGNGSTTAMEVAYGANPNPMPQTISSISDSRVQRQGSVAERLRDHHGVHHPASGASTPGSNGSSTPSSANTSQQQQQQAANDRKSNTDRLRSILEEPALRHLFREFLRGNFCEENLSFWLDVQDFKRRFHTTSSAIANNAPAPGSLAAGGSQSQGQSQTATQFANQVPIRGPNGAVLTPGQAAMAKHHESLVAMTFVIYNTYLAQGSACELNIDHALRNELFAYVNDVLVQHHSLAVSQQQQQQQSAAGGSEAQKKTPKVLLKGRVEPDQASVFNATQLQMIIRIYERIQMHVFRLMATDSVPKVCSPRFLWLF